MRDVFVSEVECENTDDYVRQFLVGGDKSMEKSVDGNGALIYDLIIDGLHQRLAFTAAD